MLELAGRFIAACWCVFAVVWFVAAWFAKRTVVRSDKWVRVILVIGLAIVVANRSRGFSAPDTTSLWQVTPALALVAVIITAAGLFVALWARATLGTNWSGAIVLKERHELIVRGPYAFVRHPIYTGLLLMVIGTATFWATRAAVAMFATIVIGVLLKAIREERLLTQYFPDAYPEYRARVPARIIPFVL